jgi:putative DNA primase/helicase
MIDDPPKDAADVLARGWRLEPRGEAIAPPVNGTAHKRPTARPRAALTSSPATQLAIADRLVRSFGRDLRYCAQLGGWYVWSGAHWARDNREVSRERAKDVARELAAEAAGSMDKDLFKLATDINKASGITSLLHLARSVPSIVFGPEDTNRDPFLLNVSNGVLDLRTGQLRPHRREDMITRRCNVSFDAGAKAPTFQKFLAEVQPDPDVRAYLARLFGYAAIGVVREHVLGVCWGPGANGKSVLADAITHVLGDYAKPGPSTLITRTGDHDPHPTDIASCVGSRLVTVHETRQGAKFDASKVKLLTGGDRLTARFMRQDFFEFEPTHTLIMLSNYKPSADSSDAALWRRVHLIPFEVVIPEEQRDARLGERIRAEASGILNWLVSGALEWSRIGLAPPKAVLEQTRSYRLAEDFVAAFLDECTTRYAQARVAAGALYSAYKAWADSNGHRPVRGNDFAAEIEGRGFERTRASGGRHYSGLALRNTEDDRWTD